MVPLGQAAVAVSLRAYVSGPSEWFFVSTLFMIGPLRDLTLGAGSRDDGFDVYGSRRATGCGGHGMSMRSSVVRGEIDGYTSGANLSGRPL